MKKSGYGKLICAAASVVILLWVAMTVNPAAEGQKGRTNDLIVQFSNNVHNLKADAMSDVVYIEKTKKIPLSDFTAPEPDQTCYGSVPCSEAEKVLDVIREAEENGVLAGQDVIFDTGAEFNANKDIQYYLDDTILAICWSEMINGRVCNCAEIKIKDASQFRRKVAGDSFGSQSAAYTNGYSKEVNAVIAMNGDFYAFRSYGVCVFQGELCRFNERYYKAEESYSYNYIDSMFVDKNGDFSFLRRGDVLSRGDMEQFVEENGVMFSLAFGPVLVDNYEVQETLPYPIGEGNSVASRAGIGQFDKLHYLYMNVQASGRYGANTDEFAAFMASKGLRCAYNLDGGQTAEFTINNRDYNDIDRGSRRPVSDIIYFATAS